MKSTWLQLEAKVQSELQPILVQAGYSFRRSGATENNDDIVIFYEKDSTHRILIDAMEVSVYESGVSKTFNWLRVDVNGKYLKELTGTASETDMYLFDGWIWVNDEELDQCIQEIGKGLRAYFE